MVQSKPAVALGRNESSIVRIPNPLIRLAVVLAITVVGGFAMAEQWTQFRGSRMDGVAQSKHPERWDENTNVDWSIDVPGEGWSCPVIWDDRLFLTAAVPVASGGPSSAGPEEYTGGGGSRRDDLTQVTFRWQVICLDAETGTERWRKTAREGRPSIPRHSSNTYATETPITIQRSRERCCVIEFSLGTGGARPNYPVPGLESCDSQHVHRAVVPWCPGAARPTVAP